MPLSADELTEFNATIPDSLAARLSDPNVAAGVAALLDHIDVVVLAVSSLDGLLAHSETILDSAIDSVGDARTLLTNTPELAKVDWKGTTDSLAQLAAALPGMTPALIRGAESGAIDELTSPSMVKLLHMGSAAANDALSSTNPVNLDGPLSALRALKDPDTARGLSFLMTVAREIGKQLSEGKQ